MNDSLPVMLKRIHSPATHPSLELAVLERFGGERSRWRGVRGCAVVKLVEVLDVPASLGVGEFVQVSHGGGGFLELVC
jgi:hypothetical protein